MRANSNPAFPSRRPSACWHHGPRIYVSVVISSLLGPAALAQPSAPTLYEPANGAVVCSDTPTLFDWSNVTSATGYEIQFDSETPIDTGATSSFELITGAIGLHYWRARAYNGSGNGPWSSSRSFTVSDGPGSSPSLYSPPSGATVCADVPTLFDWGTVSGA
ncbi:MAG: hypothetical protein JW741_29765, partial [Sedimentisphaerales bacterium]|nr:hypothetical protein [Sedimentisphaerales bacterium]